MVTVQELDRIEELRRKLHRELGAQYDPVRMQALAPISQEFDRLTIELVRREIDQLRERPFK